MLSGPLFCRPGEWGRGRLVLQTHCLHVCVCWGRWPYCKTAFRHQALNSGYSSEIIPFMEFFLPASPKEKLWRIQANIIWRIHHESVGSSTSDGRKMFKSQFVSYSSYLYEIHDRDKRSLSNPLIRRRNRYITQINNAQLPHVAFVLKPHLSTCFKYMHTHTHPHTNPFPNHFSDNENPDCFSLNQN